MSEENRFIHFGCKLCGEMSPVCDQKEDIARRGPAEWYQKHLADNHAHPTPAIFRADRKTIQWGQGGHETDEVGSTGHRRREGS